jgi:intracellular septation protein
VAIVATIAQIAWLRSSTGKVEPMQWLSLGSSCVFGGATILAHDETFIKWKPTVLYWLMAARWPAASCCLPQEPAEVADGSQMELPEPAGAR